MSQPSNSSIPSAHNISILDVFNNSTKRYVDLLSIDPGYANMGIATVRYDRVTKTAVVTSIGIISVGTRKSTDTTITNKITEIFSKDVRGKYDCCIIEKQGGFAQSKVIRVEQHIVTLLQHGYNIPVYVFSPRLRGRIKHDDLSTPQWLTQRCRDVLSKCSAQNIRDQFESLTPKQKTDVGAAITQVAYFLSTNNLAV